MNKKAKWIWINNSPGKNEYAVFEDSFNFNTGKAVFCVSAESDYILSVNGTVCSFGQLPSYPFEKYYDEIDISQLCRVGENKFTLTVRYEGVNSATHIDNGAGVIFTLEVDGKLILHSDENTPCGYDTRYLQGKCRHISPQLGLASDMITEAYVLNCGAVIREMSYNLKKRPIKKAFLGDFCEGVTVFGKNNIYDLGKETAGYLRVRFKTASVAKLSIAYGEHLNDGCVRQKIGGRAFRLDFYASEAGEFLLTQYFVRIAGRYLEAILPDGVEIISIGIIPSLQPFTKRPLSLSGIDKEIYETCVRTLELCVNHHYEDCPWREQALYVLDSRNQMLCGYNAFFETDFARANLAYIAKGTREDGLLELTYPAINTPAIPFFSLMYPVCVYEYIINTGDSSIATEVMPTMFGIIGEFSRRIDKNGLIKDFSQPYWNFYEWTDKNDGSASSSDTYSLILNCAFVYSCERFLRISDYSEYDLNVNLSNIKESIKRTFYHSDTGLFHTSTHETSHYSELGNAMASLIGLGDQKIAEALKNGSLSRASLSTLSFVYDALLLLDPQSKDYILSDIRKNYSYMLSQGATSFWETLKGESDFEGAGSLCHGWSAMPIYYYSILGGKK